MNSSDHRIFDHFLNICRTEFVKVMRCKFKPSGKRIAANDCCSNRYHVIPPSPKGEFMKSLILPETYLQKSFLLSYFKYRLSSPLRGQGAIYQHLYTIQLIYAHA